MTTHDSYSYSLWLIKKSSVCLLSCHFRWESCCLPDLTSCSTTSSFLWSVLSHWLSWHTQTETLLMSLKAFSSPPVLLEATKHRLNWPEITFAPLSVSHLPTCRTPLSPSLCFLQLTGILIFHLLYLSSLHLHLFCSHFHSERLSCFLNLAHRLLCGPCSILSQTDCWTIQLWIRLSLYLYACYCVCVCVDVCGCEGSICM